MVSNNAPSAVAAQFDTLVTGLVTQARDEGTLRADLEPAVAARLLFGMINSVVEWYRPRRGDKPEDLAEAIRLVGFSGLRRCADPVASCHDIAL